jgi:hypothetical protein
MTTRVTPSSRSRSASRSSERVIVEYVAISCARRPGVSGLGTRTQATSSALPMSNAATRSMMSSRSWVSSSIAVLPAPAHHGGRPQELQGTGESNPRARSDTEGPTAQLPASD